MAAEDPAGPRLACHIGRWRQQSRALLRLRGLSLTGPPAVGCQYGRPGWSRTRILSSAAPDPGDDLLSRPRLPRTLAESGCCPYCGIIIFFVCARRLNPIEF